MFFSAAEGLILPLSFSLGMDGGHAHDGGARISADRDEDGTGVTDETREQLARMPFDLGNHPALLALGRGPILEILEEPPHLGLRGPTHGPCEPMGIFSRRTVLAGKRMA